MGTVMAEQQGPRLQGKEMAERLEVLLQVERRSGRDRHEDFVAGKVEAGGIARVDASIPFVEDRELVRRMTGGVVEHQGMRPQVESILILYRDEPVRRNRAHRRSEEHTSELQSHHDLVCRLLLEK